MPGAPGAPTPSDTTPTSVILSWTQPESDGGSPILGYTVEMKDKFSSRWSKVNRDLVQETTLTVPTLKENQDYQFRVVAENKAGPGKPSPEVRVTAKYPFGKFERSTTIIF